MDFLVIVDVNRVILFESLEIFYLKKKSRLRLRCHVKVC